VHDLDNEQKPCSRVFGETELRECLEHEQNTARRQRLLKALWKLSQQREGVGSTPDARTIAASSTVQPQPSESAAEARGTLVVSC
jgi:hypothetical protein